MQRLNFGDRHTAVIVLRSLLHGLNDVEQIKLLEAILVSESAFQTELIEMAMTHPDVGFITTATRDKYRQCSDDNDDSVPRLIFRNITIILDLQAKSDKIRAWLFAHRLLWEWMYEWLRIESLKPALGGRVSVFFREPAKLQALRRLGILLGIPYCEEQRCYVVEGAALEDVNGIYRSTARTHGGCLVYTMKKKGVNDEDVMYALYHYSDVEEDICQWYIARLDGTADLDDWDGDYDLYSRKCSHGEELPPERGWMSESGGKSDTTQMPTVRLYSSTLARGIGVTVKSGVDCGVEKQQPCQCRCKRRRE